MNKARMERVAAVGVAENGNSAMLVTIARGELIDRRKVDLTHDLPTHPYHHEGSWAVGRYLNSAWARTTSMPEALAIIERVREAARLGAIECLESLARTASVPITGIAIRECPELPSSPRQIIEDARLASVADSAMYREALANAAKTRGWSVYWYNRDSVTLEAAAALAGEDLDELLRAMGKTVGPPWTAKHKLAAAAALAASARL